CLVAAIAAAQAWRVAAQVDLAPLVSLEMWIGAHWSWPEDTVRSLLAHQLPAYLGHFALGMYLGKLWLDLRGRRVPRRMLDMAGLLAILGLAVCLAHGWPPGALAWTVAPIALALPLFAAAREGTWISAALTRGPLAFLGRVSYSIYLYHLPLLILLAASLDALGLAALPAYVAVVTLVGWVSWRVVEEPWRRRGRPRAALAARAPADSERGSDGEQLQGGDAPEHLREAARVHEGAEH
ncbi:MAG TPA: acyltransferase family protein, partial [Usitatibacter sp.]|nr:acyltransferase family protein [Usitatibacter sp.]